MKKIGKLNMSVVSRHCKEKTCMCQELYEELTTDALWTHRNGSSASTLLTSHCCSLLPDSRLTTTVYIQSYEHAHFASPTHEFFLMKRTCLFATPVEETAGRAFTTWPKIEFRFSFSWTGKTEADKLGVPYSGEEKQKLIMGSRTCSQKYFKNLTKLYLHIWLILKTWLNVLGGWCWRRL
jgi:hypothetical protein